MNELVDSDPELYAGDVDEAKVTKKSAKEKLKADIKNHLNNNDINVGGIITSESNVDADTLSNGVDEDEISLIDPEESQERLKERKE